MGKTIRITRKTLKEDEVRSYWFDLIKWAQQQRKPLTVGAIAVFAAFVIVQVYRHRVAAQAEAVGRLVSTAQMEIQYALMTKDDQAREKRFISADEKLQAVTDVYRRSKLVPYAIYLRGNIAFFRNNYDEAAQFYKDYLSAVTDPIEKADGHIALGYAYENKFFWTPQKAEDRLWLEQALQNYLDAENLTSGTMEHYIAMLGRARLYDLQEDRAAQAKELYERIERERKIEWPEPSAGAKQNPHRWLLNQTEEMKRLFTLAETARLRRERLEASE
jgi:tetratricopeptide (TPR) repeat protein